MHPEPRWRRWFETWPITKWAALDFVIGLLVGAGAVIALTIFVAYLVILTNSSVFGNFLDLYYRVIQPVIVIGAAVATMRRYGWLGLGVLLGGLPASGYVMWLLHALETSD